MMGQIVNGMTFEAATDLLCTTASNLRSAGVQVGKYESGDLYIMSVSVRPPG